MTKREILESSDTKLFVLLHDYTIKLVHEANSNRGETQKTSKEFEWIVDECIKRFSLDRHMLIERDIIR